MSDALRSLIQCGTKLWLDSIDPDLVKENRGFGATGATSNPIIIADLIKTGRFDDPIAQLIDAGYEDHDIAWAMTDALVKEAQDVFLPVWNETSGNDGYVSFEVDPLLEDPEANVAHERRIQQYIQLATKWAAGHKNRMIKVPATKAGLAAIETIAARNIPLNVTLIFTSDQYRTARDAIWSGVRKSGHVDTFKSVYSIFVSRIDVYTAQHCQSLSDAAQGQVGIVNAQRIWAENQTFWQDKNCPLQQEIIFASTGTKRPEDPAWKYVQALAGSDIQTNPPATNQAVAESGIEFTRRVDILPDRSVRTEIDNQVDFDHMRETLMFEGIAKFANPQKELIALIGAKRAALANT